MRNTTAGGMCVQLVFVCCYLGEAVEGQGLFRHKETDHHVPSHRAIRRGCQPKQCNTLRAQARLRPGLRAQQQQGSTRVAVIVYTAAAGAAVLNQGSCPGCPLRGVLARVACLSARAIAATHSACEGYLESVFCFCPLLLQLKIKRSLEHSGVSLQEVACSCLLGASATTAAAAGTAASRRACWCLLLQVRTHNLDIGLQVTVLPCSCVGSCCCSQCCCLRRGLQACALLPAARCVECEPCGAAIASCVLLLFLCKLVSPLLPLLGELSGALGCCFGCI